MCWKKAEDFDGYCMVRIDRGGLNSRKAATCALGLESIGGFITVFFFIWSSTESNSRAAGTTYADQKGCRFEIPIHQTCGGLHRRTQ